MAGGAREPGQSVTSKVLAVLGSFDADHPRLTLSEIAQRSGVPLSTCHRLLAELEAWRAVQRRPSGEYGIGRRVWELGLLAPVHHDLAEVAAPFLHDVHSATGEVVHLAVREDLTALYIDRVSGSASVSVVSKPGSRLPLHATGVGKVLLAYAPAEVVEAAVASATRVTRHTITEPGRLHRELQEVRRRGYAHTSEEMTLGTCSIAVPIRTRGGVVASLGIVVNSVKRDLVRLLPGLNVASAGIGRTLEGPLSTEPLRQGSG